MEFEFQEPKNICDTMLVIPFTVNGIPFKVTCQNNFYAFLVYNGEVINKSLFITHDISDIDEVKRKIEKYFPKVKKAMKVVNNG